MNDLKPILPLVLLIALPYASAANYIKCVDANGKTVYTDGFCPQTAPSARQPESAASVTKGGRAVISAGLANVYSRQIAALQSNNWSGYLDTLAARRQAESAGMTELETAKAMAPVDVQVVEEIVAANGSSGTLKVKGMIPTSGKDEAQYGTIEFVREAGEWKMDRQAWSDREWVRAKATGTAMTAMQKDACADLAAKPESLPVHEMLKVTFAETQVAKFELAPGGTREVSFPAASPQKVNFRVAFNNALKCKYKGDYPTGMSTDGGKTWVYSYHAGQNIKPKDGKVTLSFKNKGQEPMNMVVVKQ